MILVLGSYKEVLDGIFSSEEYLSPMLSTNVLKALTQALGVYHYYVCFLYVRGSSCVVLLNGTIVVVIRIRLDSVLYLNPS